MTNTDILDSFIDFDWLTDPFQYEIVAVVANDAHINSVHDLRGSRLCHPGHGLSRHWTDVMANVSNKLGVNIDSNEAFLFQLTQMFWRNFSSLLNIFINIRIHCFSFHFRSFYNW